MTYAATQLAAARRLRVSIYAENAVRRSALRRIVIDAGHDVADLPEAADVLLCDGDCSSTEGRPFVALGGADTDQAGLLPRDANATQIDAALRAVAAGLTVRSPAGAETGFAAMKDADLRTLLTLREIEVLSAISEGLTNKVIARRLNISLHTVKFHIESLFRKLGVRTRTEAVAKASERRRIETVEL
jgi:two-component system nitrate/nitrite response regulator NarL